jgi:sugar lactone lactonase YvrE
MPFTTHPSRRLSAALIIALVTSLIGSGVALADGHVGVLVQFDEAQGQLPEGIAVNKQGDIFVGLAPLGTIVKVEVGSTDYEPFGQVAGINPNTDFGVLGLAVSAGGDVYAGVQSANPSANGVWVFDGQTGEGSKVDGTEAIAIANDVAFDKRGNLYITDSALGAIWRVPKHGALELWLVDAALAGNGVLGAGVPIGANGVEHHHGVLYVAVTEQFSVVAVPIGPDGAPGEPQLVTTFPPDGFGAPGAPDGLAIDVHGDVYAALIGQQKIVRVDGAAEVTEIASGDPLDWPSSIAFGTSRGEQKTLFAVNFSIGEGFGDPVPRMGPSLVAISVGVPGAPLP